MKNKHRTAPFFPAASATIEAPQAVFHPGTEVLAAEAAHHEAVDTLEAPETPKSAAQTPADAPEPDYTLGTPSIADLQKAYAQATFGGHQPDSFVGALSAKDDGKGFLVDMDALADEDDELDARIDAQLKAAMGSTAIELPDGSIKIPITVDADKISVLREWADGAGESFEDYLTKMVDMGLEAIVNGGAIAG